MKERQQSQMFLVLIHDSAFPPQARPSGAMLDFSRWVLARGSIAAGKAFPTERCGADRLSLPATMERRSPGGWLATAILLLELRNERGQLHHAERLGEDPVKTTLVGQ